MKKSLALLIIFLVTGFFGTDFAQGAGWSISCPLSVTTGSILSVSLIEGCSNTGPITYKHRFMVTLNGTLLNNTEGKWGPFLRNKTTVAPLCPQTPNSYALTIMDENQVPSILSGKVARVTVTEINQFGKAGSSDACYVEIK
jgi:hypothetical protein